MFRHFQSGKLHLIKHQPTPDSAANAVLSEGDFADALAEISAWQGYAPTPLHALPNLASALQLGTVHYKDEGPRFGLGSFKALGAAYAACRVLQQQISRQRGLTVTLADIRAGKYAKDAAEITLVTATDGNHGRSLAWGAQRFGAACRIYIHSEVSQNRADAMTDLGADVIRIDGDYDASVRIARVDAARHGWFVVSDTSWAGYTEPPRDVMAGYGVLIHEVNHALETAPTHVLVQGGVGGIAAAVAAGMRHRWGEQCPRIIVVEPDRAACLFTSARKGEITSVDIQTETMMAGLSCGEPSPLAWDILRKEAFAFTTIPDSFVAPAMRLLGNSLGNDPAITAGESAVAGLAALIAACTDTTHRDILGLDDTARVVLVGTEGATDPDIYRKIMAG